MTRLFDRKRYEASRYTAPQEMDVISKSDENWKSLKVQTRVIKR